jgi:hypothetical protein
MSFLFDLYILIMTLKFKRFEIQTHTHTHTHTHTQIRMHRETFDCLWPNDKQRSNHQCRTVLDNYHYHPTIHKRKKCWPYPLPVYQSPSGTPKLCLHQAMKRYTWFPMRDQGDIRKDQIGSSIFMPAIKAQDHTPSLAPSVQMTWKVYTSTPLIHREMPLHPGIRPG